MNPTTIQLEALLKALVAPKNKEITVNLYDQDNLSIITFQLPGYKALEDQIEECEVTKIVINNLYSIDITIDTSNLNP